MTSIVEIHEYQKLYEEFKYTVEGSKHPRVSDIGTFATVMACVPKDDMLRVAFDKCVRYNRYLELRTLCAPYFYDLLVKNGIKLC